MTAADTGRRAASAFADDRLADDLYVTAAVTRVPHETRSKPL